MKNRPPKEVTIPVYKYLTAGTPATQTEQAGFGIEVFTGFGVGMCIVGLLIGFVISKVKGNSQTKESDDAESNSSHDSESKDGDAEEMQKLNDPEAQEKVEIEPTTEKFIDNIGSPV